MSTLLAWLGLIEGHKEVVDPEYDRQLVRLESHEGGHLYNAHRVKWPGMAHNHYVTRIGFYHDRVGGRPFNSDFLDVPLRIMGRTVARDQAKEYRPWQFWRRRKGIVMFRAPDCVEVKESQVEFWFNGGGGG